RLERRAQPRRLGINENLAREILELHTLGVGGGYTQTDVTAFAEVITGWSIGGEGGGPFAGGEPGKFLFRPELHEPGAKRVLGTRYADSGYGQGVAVLRDLAGHRSTARFIATKLARHFIADDPPPEAVGRLALAFTRSGGDLPTVYRALIGSREAWVQPLAKYKTPSDYIISGFRGLTLPVQAAAPSLTRPAPRRRSRCCSPRPNSCAVEPLRTLWPCSDVNFSTWAHCSPVARCSLRGSPSLAPMSAARASC